MPKLFCLYRSDRNYLPNLLRLHRTAIQLGIYKRSFRMTLAVGTVLNLINQPQALLGFVFLDFQDMKCLNVTKTVLTYTVPFLVATYSALAVLDFQVIDSQGKPSA